MKKVNEYDIGDKVLVEYDDGNHHVKVVGTIIDKWWSNKWDAREPDPEYPDLKEEWFYHFGTDFEVFNKDMVRVSKAIVGKDIKFAISGEVHKSFLIKKVLLPECKLKKKLVWTE